MVTAVEQPAQQSQIVQSVRQQMEQARPVGPQGDGTQQEGEEAAQGTATTSEQGVQRLSNILSALGCASMIISCSSWATRRSAPSPPRCASRAS